MTAAARERAQARLPILLASALAWGLLLFGPAGTGLQAHCASMPMGTAASIGMLLVHNPPGRLAIGWLVMLVAMMFPVMTSAVKHVRDRSFRQRSIRAVALFLLSYLSIWMVAGIALLAAALIVRLLSGDSLTCLALFALVSLVWEVSPWKQICLNRGHAHPELAAFGRAADVDVVRFGWTHGFWCIGSCWVLMLLPMLLSRGHVVAMGLVTLWIVAERLERPRAPGWDVRGPRKAIRIAAAQVRWVRSAGDRSRAAG